MKLRSLCCLLFAAALSGCAVSKPKPVAPPLPPEQPVRRTAAAPVAPSVGLIWDASPDATVTGYALYHGVGSTNVTVRVDVGQTNQATIGGLTVGVANYFFCTAYNAAGVESVPSNTLAYTPAAGEPDMIFRYTLQNWTNGLWLPVGSIMLTNPPGDVNFYRVEMTKVP